MVDYIQYNNKKYFKFQSEGNAAQFILPFATKLCTGFGVDVGCGKIEWALPNAIPIDPKINSKYNAYSFPENAINLDYVFSSHCLEHLPNWVNALDYWDSKIKPKGVMFLYLPDYSQEYWRPWNNKKHLSIFSSSIIEDYLLSKRYINIYKTGVDFNNSFAVFGEKL